MFTFNNKGVHFNTKYLSAFVVNKPVYNVNLVQTQGGTINASPLTGYEDTEVTLSNTPDTDYEFDSYSLTGATLYDSNKFILNNDVTAQATWTYVPPPTPPDEVTIGTQTWKAQNLAVDDGGSGIYHVDNVVINGVDVGTQYYYTQGAAQRIADSIDGWHLPTSAEWQTLYSYCAPSATYKLKSTSGWKNYFTAYGDANGTDEFGFCALPCSYYNSATSAIVSTNGVYGFFMTNSYTTAIRYPAIVYRNPAIYNWFKQGDEDVNLLLTGDSIYRIVSVRLVKDS